MENTRMRLVVKPAAFAFILYIAKNTAYLFNGMMI